MEYLVVDLQSWKSQPDVINYCRTCSDLGNSDDFDGLEMVEQVSACISRLAPAGGIVKTPAIYGAWDEGVQNFQEIMDVRMSKGEDVEAGQNTLALLLTVSQSLPELLSILESAGCIRRVTRISHPTPPRNGGRKRSTPDEPPLRKQKKQKMLKTALKSPVMTMTSATTPPATAAKSSKTSSLVVGSTYRHKHKQTLVQILADEGQGFNLEIATMPTGHHIEITKETFLLNYEPVDDTFDAK